MNRDQINVLARQLLAHYRASESSPEKRAPARIDLTHYRDISQFEAERRILFRESPLLLGMSVDLPNVGSVKTNDYLDVPILLVRGEDRRVRAFANTCRHRGGKLVDEPTCLGMRKNLTCPFHGWVYALDGGLKHVQNEALFGVVDKRRHGLIEVPCVEQYGMIFVRPAPGATISLDAHLGASFAMELADWKFDTLHFVDATTIDNASNWKLQIDTFLESYHVESLHRSTIGPLSLSGYALRQSFGPHQRLVFAAQTLKGIGDLPADSLDGHKHVTIVYSIFPNIFIVYGPLWVQYFEVYPGKAIDSQRTRFALYARKPPSNEAQRQAGRDYFDLNLRFVPNEDYVMGAQTTRAVLSGVGDYHLFGCAEDALVHFHRELRAALGLQPDDIFYSEPC